MHCFWNTIFLETTTKKQSEHCSFTRKREAPPQTSLKWAEDGGFNFEPQNFSDKNALIVLPSFNHFTIFSSSRAASVNLVPFLDLNPETAARGAKNVWLATKSKPVFEKQTSYWTASVKRHENKLHVFLSVKSNFELKGAKNFTTGKTKSV